MRWPSLQSPYIRESTSCTHLQALSLTFFNFPKSFVLSNMRLFLSFIWSSEAMALVNFKRAVPLLVVNAWSAQYPFFIQHWCTKYYIYIPWPFPPVWGVANYTERTKQWGFYSVLLAMKRDPAEFGWHYWSNAAHPPLSSTTQNTPEYNFFFLLN